MSIDISKRRNRYITIAPSKKSGLSAYALKLIAISAMLIDHIAWMFVETGSVPGQLMHVIGRITAPVICFFIAEGYHRTHNIKSYAIRLGIFALISHLPFVYFQTGKIMLFSNTSVIYTLFIGLMALIVINNDKMSSTARYLICFLLCIASMIGDWGGIGVIWILLFGMGYGNKKKQLKDFIVASVVFCIIISVSMLLLGYNWYDQIFQFGVLLAVPLLNKYNGLRGGGRSIKWLFYIFYPLHMVVLGLIYECIR